MLHFVQKFKMPHDTRREACDYEQFKSTSSGALAILGFVTMLGFGVPLSLTRILYPNSDTLRVRGYTFG